MGGDHQATDKLTQAGRAVKEAGEGLRVTLVEGSTHVDRVFPWLYYGHMKEEDTERGWTVLVIGGAAGVGKTTTARDLAARCGVSVLPTDAIWLALKAATDPTSHPELHHFDPPDAEWQGHKAEYWCERHIESAEAIGRAMDPVIEYYLLERWPVIVEGTWITPAAAARWSRQYEGLRAVFIHEPEDLRAHLLSRGARPRHRGETFWLIGNWMREQAETNGLAVVNVQPRATLAERVLGAIETGSV